MTTGSTHVADSAELWRLLCTRGGLQLESYDHELVAELRRRLDIPAPQDIDGTLRHRPVSPEEFVGAFFGAAGPYVRMWSDILHMFEMAGAQSTNQNLDIEFDFGAERPKLSFDLANFRAQVAVALALMAPISFDRVTSRDFFELTRTLIEVLDDADWTSPTGDRGVDRFVDEINTARRWPSELPARPRSADPLVDAVLIELWQIMWPLLRGLQEAAPDYEALRRRDSTAGLVVLGLPFDQLQNLGSDVWLRPIALLAHRLSRVPSGQLAATLPKVQLLLRKFENHNPRWTTPGARLEDLLRLPMWDRRHDLYSTWVCARVLSALSDQQPQFHVVGGALRFSFGGTHVATLQQPATHPEVWTEVRSAIDFEPRGHGRKGQIQPDLRVMVGSPPDATTVLAVECKQYLRPGIKNFSDALHDYLRGLPETDVVLATYGSTPSERVLDRTGDDLVGRATIAADLRPGRSDALERFREVVRRTVLPTPVQLDIDGGDGSVVLSWTSPPRDLDLHLTVPTTPTATEVDFRTPGARDAEPHCTLEQDVTTGEDVERIIVHRWLPGIYEVRVVQYSDDGAVRPAGAEVTVSLPTGSTTFPSPPLTAKASWTVCRIDGATKTIVES